MPKAVLYVFLLLLTSCASTNQYPTDSAFGLSENNYAILHVTRPSIIGSAILVPVRVNGVLIGDIASGGHIKTKIPTGKVTIYSSTNNVSFDAKRFGEYHVEVTFPLQTWLFTPDVVVTLKKNLPKK